MVWVDAFFRFSGLGLLLLTIPLVWVAKAETKSMFFLLLTQIMVLVHLLGFTPPIFHPPDLLRQTFRMLDVGLIVAVWFFVLSLFKQDFKISLFHLVLGVFVVLLMLAERLVQFGHLETLPNWWQHVVNASAFFISIHMMYFALTGHTDDLVEARRKTRILMMLMVVIAATIMIVLGSVLLPEFQPTINAISLWPVIFALSYWVMGVDRSVFAFDSVKQPQPLSARDQILDHQLHQVMEEERIYLLNNLSINDLAQKLGVGTPRLRQHINQHLGFENFSNFINEYRINDIKKVLCDHKYEHLPVLTIALNHGFNSLPPFNRAFKKIMGQTPTEYRKSH